MDTLLSKVRVTVADAVAAWLKPAVQTLETRDADTTVVLAGIPGPVTATPGPMAKMVVAKVTLVEALVVVPEAVKTPTAATVAPPNTPNRGLVLMVLVMSFKFWPGWAIIWFTPPPVESYPMSNCHKVLSLGE